MSKEKNDLHSMFLNILFGSGNSTFSNIAANLF